MHGGLLPDPAFLPACRTNHGAAAFLARPPFSTGTFCVDCRCSENPVAPRDWDKILQNNHVIVMTPQSYLNLLDGGYAHLDCIDILVGRVNFSLKGGCMPVDLPMQL